MRMAEIHFKHSLSFAAFSIFLIFYGSKIAVAGKSFPALGDPVTLSLRKEKFSHFRLYSHTKGGDPNPTIVQVGGANTTENSVTRFGAIGVFDDPLTEGPESSSKLLGRAQGFKASAGIDEIAVLAIENFVFTTGKYNGSTLGAMGRKTLLSEVREMPIVGGTGLLRFARGYVETRIHGFNITAFEATFEYNIYVYHF
ncbi:hypothetical protein MKW94_017177 [Papaver nudicaule]|uniref:Dirigent protein n=1 Tax=Papaver nudicaule TaxID=74823 RepID=A0AA41VGP6_PAPNU|nr:hypothetical protein [Papaver nudicaule]